MYKSPITIIESTIDSFTKSIIKQKDDAVFAEIQHSFGVDLDRDELIRALKNDRDQYEKGYADGKADAMNELVRCKYCYYYGEKYPGHGYCKYFDTLRIDNDFCSSGQRRDNDT